MLNADAAEEIEQLKANLLLIRENYLTHWTGEPREEARRNLLDFHLKKLEAEQAVINDLEQNILKKRDKTRELEQGITDNDNKIVKINHIISDLKTKEEELCESKQTFEGEINATNRSLEEKLKEADTLQKTFTTKWDHLNKALEFFENRLGLKIKKGQDGELQFIFTHIDEGDWNKEFTFNVLVDNENSYKVLRSDPPVPNIESLTENLNRTNNFSRFVSKMRACYKTLASSQENLELAQKEYGPPEEANAAAKVLDELTNKISVVEV